jgi:hypothetical protein
MISIGALTVKSGLGGEGDPSESRDGGAAQRGCCVAGMQLCWLRALAYRIVNLDISAKLRSVSGEQGSSRNHAPDDAEKMG